MHGLARSLEEGLGEVPPEKVQADLRDVLLYAPSLPQAHYLQLQLLMASRTLWRQVGQVSYPRSETMRFFFFLVASPSAPLRFSTRCHFARERQFRGRFLMMRSHKSSMV